MSAREVRVEELAGFCESLSQDLMRSHEKRFGERLKVVREASLGLDNAAKRFASGVKNAWGTLDKTALEYGMRLAHNLEETAQDLSRKDTASNYQNTESYHETAVEALNRTITTVRKYVPKLRKGLKTEMAALNSSLAKLENSIKALGTALDESPGIKLQLLKREAELLVRRQDDLVRLRSEEQQESTSFEATSDRERELLSEKEALTSGPEFLELKRYEDSLKSKEDEIKQFLQPLAKPLLKLERVASAKKGSQIDLRTLHNLLERPVETVATGQSFATIQLLDLLEQALQRGELDIEERKLRKAEDAIAKVRDGAIDRMREDYMALQANTQETLRQMRGTGLLERRDRLDGLLSETHTERERVLTRQRELQRRIDELSGSILKQKASLESQISKFAHQSVNIDAG